MHVLKWATENGCPLDPYVLLFSKMKGHLDIMRWEQVNKCLEGTSNYDRQLIRHYCYNVGFP